MGSPHRYSHHCLNYYCLNYYCPSYYCPSYHCPSFAEPLSLNSPFSQGPMLTLPRALTLTPSQFAAVCAANPEAVLELDALGHLVELTT